MKNTVFHCILISFFIPIYKLKKYSNISNKYTNGTNLIFPNIGSASESKGIYWGSSDNSTIGSWIYYKTPEPSKDQGGLMFQVIGDENSYIIFEWVEDNLETNRHTASWITRDGVYHGTAESANSITWKNVTDKPQFLQTLIDNGLTEKKMMQTGYNDWWAIFENDATGVTGKYPISGYGELLFVLYYDDIKMTSFITIPSVNGNPWVMQKNGTRIGYDTDGHGCYLDNYGNFQAGEKTAVYLYGRKIIDTNI